MAKTRSKRNEKKNATKTETQLNELDADFIPLDSVDDSNMAEGDESVDLTATRDNRSSFFGLLDRSELEYFKNAENMLATNALNLDEREPFVDSVFAEAKGKELKLATNQVCSKLFERMVQLANDEQMEQLAKACENFAADLAYQKFSSHCLEALIRKAAQIEGCESSVELIAKNITSHALSLMNDKYGAHVMCTLILTLSGVELNTRSKRSQLARKYTEIEQQENDERDSVIEVSADLKRVVRELVISLVSKLDKVEARKLAIGSESSPVIQSLVVSEVELMSSYKLLNAILDDASGFVSHCLSDPVGSHFLETVIKVLPAKRVAKFIEDLPLQKLAISENEFSRYIVQTVISKSKLSKTRKLELIHGDLKDALNINTNLVVCALDVDFDAVASHITSEMDSKSIDLANPSNAALYEKLSKYPPFVEKAVDVLIAMEDSDVLKMGLDPTQSYVLQSLLSPRVPLIARRKLLNKLVAPTPSFAVNAYGSHIVDSLWNACFKLKFVRERIASELLKAAGQVKHSSYGKKVWKNWNMEKYAHRRHDWWQAVKDLEDKLKAEIGPEHNETTDKPYGGKPYSGKPYTGKPFTNKPYAGKPYNGKPYNGKPHPHSTEKRPDSIPPSKKRRTQTSS